MKTIDEYVELPYTFEITPEDNGTFFIKVKELTGCMSVGDTLDEAYSMIKDAMESWLSVAIDENDFIPEPEICAQKKYSGKFVVRTPTYLHKELSEKAEENGVRNCK
ncbi:MAG: type II toxin-antitoxin system HicB family antitoxin [Spirochaetia bacterium]|nr:type II toxin-antitoxin system HicB family antitoxin [Spirochaetia bacterium]